MGPMLVRRHFYLMPICVVLVCLSGTAMAEDEQFASYLAIAKTSLKVRQDADAKPVEVSRGTLLTVLTEEGDRCLVTLDEDVQGWVEKQDIVTLIDAAPVLDELVKGNPKDPHWYSLRALVWETRQKPSQAIDDLDKAIRLSDREAQFYFRRGLLLAGTGRHENAVADFDRAAKLGQSDSLLFANRGAAQLARGELDEAIADFGKVIEAEPNKVAAYYQRAVAYRNRGDMDEAVSDFSAAIRLDPHHVPATLGRGFVHFLAGRNDEAIADFTRVVQLKPDSAVAYNNRGYNLQVKGKYRQALADFKNAARIDNQYALAYQNAAWLLATCPDDTVRDGKLASQAAYWSWNLPPVGSPPDMKVLAAAYAETGDFERAIALQEKVVNAFQDKARTLEEEVLAVYRAGKPYRLSSGD